MSWIQWQGETWPQTNNQAELRLHLWPADCGHPRTSWNFDLFHLIRPPRRDDCQQERWLSIEISDLFFHESDWRRFSRHEIRATPDWHAAHEHFHRHHGIVESRVTLAAVQPKRSSNEERKSGEQERWFAHDFVLRFGTREGFCFPCELDAWMIHEDDYRRTEPEDLSVALPFASTPANLRVITQALFVGGTVEVPRSGSADPVASARSSLREAVRCDVLREPQVQWALHHSPDRKEILPIPGWASSVNFSTGVSIYDEKSATPD